MFHYIIWFTFNLPQFRVNLISCFKYNFIKMFLHCLFPKSVFALFKEMCCILTITDTCIRILKNTPGNLFSKIISPIIMTKTKKTKTKNLFCWKHNSFDILTNRIIILISIYIKICKLDFGKYGYFKIISMIIVKKTYI